MLVDSFVAIGSESDVEQILHQAVDLARLSTQARYGAIATLRNGEVERFVHQGLTSTQIKAMPHLPRGRGLLAAVLEGKSIRLERMNDDRRSIGFPLGHVPMSAFLGVPLLSDDEVAGGIYLSKPPGQGTFDEDDQLFVEALAKQTGLAIKNVNLLEQRNDEIRVRREAQRNARLLEQVAVASNHAKTLREALKACLPTVSRLAGAQVAHAYLTRGTTLVSSDLWYFEEGTNYEAFKKATDESTFAAGIGLPGTMLDSRKPHWIVGLQHNPEFSRNGAARLAGLESGFGFPVIAGDEVAAVLEMYTVEPVGRDEQLLDLMVYLGGQLGQVHLREKAENELRHADEMKTDFVAMVSHEVRTPMTSMLGFSSTLREHWDAISEQQKQDFIRIIHEQASRLARLTDDVLTMSRVEAGRLEARPGSLVIAGAVRQCFDFVGAPADEIEMDVDANLVVYADPDHLQQILLNYISNALKYGAAPIRVIGRAEGESVRITVSDCGPGIPESLVGRLFEKFSQLDSGHRRTVSGTGLGLSIVDGLAKVNSGSVGYQPNEQQGSQFWVVLPKAP